MNVLLGFAAGIGVLALLAYAFLRTPPALLARRLRIGAGIALLVVAVALLFFGRFALALPLGFTGFVILRREAGMRTTDPAGQRSSVRTAGLDMALDHDTGEMDGRILAGRHDGRMLSELRLSELMEVAEDFRGDADSLRVLESYLDRTQPGWRDDVHADEAQRHGPSPGAGGMSTKEAYEILGLEPGASETEVREAHRRLMKQVHPDRGGSAALAAKINEAKDRVLGKHR